ncbi:MAG: hypothetical protein ACTJGT_01740 [Microbacteriaceae bacterium]
MARPSGYVGGEGGQDVVKGGARLRRTLKKAGQDLEDLKAAHAAAAKVVAPEAAGRAPKSTGALASTARSSGTKTAGFVRFGSKRVPYAGVIHFGTERATSDFWKRRPIKGRPFALEAAEATEPKWGRIYLEAVEKAISHIQGA